MDARLENEGERRAASRTPCDEDVVCVGYAEMIAECDPFGCNLSQRLGSSGTAGALADLFRLVRLV